MSIFDSSINPRCIIPAGSRWRTQCPPSSSACIPTVLKTTNTHRHTRMREREGLHGCIRRAGHAFSLFLPFSLSRFLSLPVDIVSRISDSGKMRLTLMRLHFSNGRLPYSFSLSLSLSLFVLCFPSSFSLRFSHRPTVSPANDACLECNRKSRETANAFLSLSFLVDRKFRLSFSSMLFTTLVPLCATTLGPARACSRIYSELVEFPLEIAVSL